MKKGSLIVALVLLVAMVFSSCQGTPTPAKLNSVPERTYGPDLPFSLKEGVLTWGEDEITLGPKALYLDGSLTDEFVAETDYVFNDFRAMAAALTTGTEAEPMKVYIAPWVYWLHDPDQEKTTDAYQLTINNIANLHLIGLSNNPKNTVICMNFGHNEGYDGGNPTMIRISGSCNGLTMKNLTWGGYCNIDLEYDWNGHTELSREKRTDNITQCQLASYGGDKLYAENCRFVSRLNMMPFNNSQRALYVGCHFESTDDSLNGSSKAIYYDCDFEFYGTKPWGGSSGVTLIKCQFLSTLNQVANNPYQYLSKGGGGYTLIDCNYVDNYSKKLNVIFGFSDVNSAAYKAYVSNVTRNGKPLAMSELHSDNPTIDITGTAVLDNYKLVAEDGTVVYNIYNLVKGSDNWDPLNQQAIIEELHPEAFVSRALLQVSSNKSSLRMFDGATAVITPVGGTEYTYAVSNKGGEKYVTLTPSEDTATCTVTLVDALTLEPVTVVIEAIDTATGRGNAVAITVNPKIRTAPTFESAPVISQNKNGTATISYKLVSEEKNLPDASIIEWKVAEDAEGTNAISLTPARAGLQSVTLNPGHVGMYLIADITPKQSVSEAGEKTTVVMAEPIAATGLEATKHISSDFSDVPLNNNTLKAGYWTVQGYQPEDTKDGYIPLDATEVSTKYSATFIKNGVSNFGAVSPTDKPWTFGTGAKNGFLGYTGIYFNKRGARIIYTPYGDSFGDMDVTFKMAPGKTASQGFGSDKNYIDIYVKYDFETETGYGLRIYRQSGSSCCFVLMEYQDGKSKELCEPVESKAFITECSARVWTADGKLNAAVTTDAPIEYAPVNLSVEIAGNKNGSFGLVTTSSAGDNTTYLTGVTCDWK